MVQFFMRRRQQAPDRVAILVLACLVLLAPLVRAVPAGSQDTPAALTLDQAIRRGLERNLSLQVAQSRADEAEGTYQRRRSGYLPRLQLQTPFSYQSVNIKAQGISFSGVPSVVGPFTTWDFRAYAEQPLIDLQTYHGIKASGKDREARRDDYLDVRSQVIRQVAGLYLNAQSLIAQADAARSRLLTSETLARLAGDRHDAGVATGVDVLRAGVQLANDRHSLLVAKNAVQLALMNLARSVGLPLAPAPELAEPLTFRPLQPPAIEEAITKALGRRPDYRSLALQRASLEEQMQASRSRYLPKLLLSGNFGGSGQHLGELEPTGAIKLNLQFTLFDLDREGERSEIESRLRRIQAQIADQRLGIEQEVREALLNLDSAVEQVQVTGEGLQLAQRELAMAGDRFREGLGDNIEVVNAQEALARAQQNRIISLTRHADAKIALARALGDTEESYRAVLGLGAESR